MIYTITTLERSKPKYREDGSSYEARSMRCVGYMKKQEDAVTAVLDNAMDINEAGYYPLVVIEGIDQGIYSHDLYPLWFEWSDSEECYVQLDEAPVEFAKMIGFGIG